MGNVIRYFLKVMFNSMQNGQYCLGIGLETARDLARRGARVVMACRCLDKGKEAAKDIADSLQDQCKDDVSERLVIKQIELSSSKSVREFCKDFLSTEARYVTLLNVTMIILLSYLIAALVSS